MHGPYVMGSEDDSDDWQDCFRGGRQRPSAHVIGESSSDSDVSGTFDNPAHQDTDPTDLPHFEQPWGSGGLELERLHVEREGQVDEGPAIPTAPWSQGDMLHRQTIIILRNMTQRLNDLPLGARKQMRALLGAPMADRADLASTIAGSLVGAPSKTIHKVVSEVAAGKRKIAANRSTEEPRGVRRKPPSVDAVDPMAGIQVCTRVALRNIVLGRPASEYSGDLHLCKISGGEAWSGPMFEIERASL